MVVSDSSVIRWLVVLSAIGVWFPGVALPSELSLEEMIAIAQSKRDAVKIVECRIETIQRLSEGNVDLENIPEMTQEFVIDLASGRFRRELAIPDSSGRMSWSTKTFANGTEMLHVPDSHSGVIDQRDEPTEQAAKDCIMLSAALFLPPIQGGWGVDDGSVVSLLKHGVLREGTEVIDGRDCYVVDGVTEEHKGGAIVPYTTVWLDIERGVVPLKRVLYAKGGVTSSESFLTGYQAFESGGGQVVWLPTRIEATAFRGDSKFQKTVAVHDIAVNPDVDASVFRIEFPPGTNVIDTATGTRFVVSGGNSAELSTESGGVWVLLVTTILLLLSLIILLWYRKRCRRRAG